MMLHRKAFTLVEIIIVIVILGIMASFAVPKMGQAKEKAIFSDAIAGLRSAYVGQQHYHLENDEYTTSCSDLDGVTIPSLRYWQEIDCDTSGGAKVIRIDSVGAEEYWVTVDDDGVFKGSDEIIKSDGEYKYLKGLCPNECE